MSLFSVPQFFSDSEVNRCGIRGLDVVGMSCGVSDERFKLRLHFVDFVLGLFQSVG